MVIVNFVPLPTSLSKVTLPFKTSIIRFAAANPKPCPLDLWIIATKELNFHFSLTCHSVCMLFDFARSSSRTPRFTSRQKRMLVLRFVATHRQQQGVICFHNNTTISVLKPPKCFGGSGVNETRKVPSSPLSPIKVLKSAST